MLTFPLLLIEIFTVINIFIYIMIILMLRDAGSFTQNSGQSLVVKIV